MLAALGSELDISYQHDGTYSNKVFGDVDTHREVRLLDAIAVALTTGNPGDVFTATFCKRDHMDLVRGPPSPEDIAAKNELVLLTGSLTVKDALDLFPFLMRRCGANNR